MNIELATVLQGITFLCVALIFAALMVNMPLLVVAIATLALAVVGFILIGWFWQLLLQLLTSAIFFAFWRAQRQHSR
ncbi:MAG: hypothetical protein IPP88_14325 [Betaproteobacteria bacterium]|nr:hypothetical protein [Betaproteobacteria bacterium]